MERRVNIFGKNIFLTCTDSEESLLLFKELDIYPSFSESNNVDIHISYLGEGHFNEDTTSILSQNPAIHKSIDNGFIISMGVANIKYLFTGDSISSVQFKINKKSPFKKQLSKWMSMQFTSTGIGDIGQVFHELILVPLIFLFKGYSLIHASSIISSKDKLIAFGGTGGVGKTSLELELCKNHNATFVSDDILPLDINGNAYPNLAYPKIYGYNVAGDETLKSEMIPNVFSLNNLHWKLRSKLFGLNKVRRRLSPITFYGRAINKPSKINAFVLLYRCQTSSLQLEKIDSQTVAYSNMLVISTEYPIFLNHILWHEYNSKLGSRTETVSYSEYQKNNQDNLVKGLSNSNCYLLKIPLNINHGVFKSEVPKMLASEGLI